MQGFLWALLAPTGIWVGLAVLGGWYAIRYARGGHIYWWELPIGVGACVAGKLTALAIKSYRRKG